MTLQLSVPSKIRTGVERLASVFVLPHPEPDSPEVRNLNPNPDTKAVAMRAAIEHERAEGCQVYGAREKNLVGYDLTSFDLASGNRRLIVVNGIAAAGGSGLLTPSEHRVAGPARLLLAICRHEPRRRSAEAHGHQGARAAAMERGGERPAFRPVRTGDQWQKD